LFNIIVSVAVMFFKLFLVFLLREKALCILWLFRIFLSGGIVLLFFATINVSFLQQLTAISLVLQLMFTKGD